MRLGFRSEIFVLPLLISKKVDLWNRGGSDRVHGPASLCITVCAFQLVYYGLCIICALVSRGDRLSRWRGAAAAKPTADQAKHFTRPDAEKHQQQNDRRHQKRRFDGGFNDFEQKRKNEPSNDNGTGDENDGLHNTLTANVVL